MANEKDIQLEITLKGIKDIQKQLKSLQKTAKQESDKIGKALYDANIKAELFSEGIQLVKGSLSAMYGAMKNAVQESIRFTRAFKGLESVSNSFKLSVDKTKTAAMNLSKDGLMSIADASMGLKNLLSSGFGLPEAIKIMERFKDVAAFNRQGTMEFGQAIVSATQGIKNQNSILVDNVGITKNISVILKEAGYQMRDLDSKTEGANAKLALFNGLMKESAPYIGDANKMADTFEGTLSKMNMQFKVLNAKFGDLITQTPAIVAGVKKIGEMMFTTAEAGFKLAQAITDILSADWYKLNAVNQLVSDPEKFKMSSAMNLYKKLPGEASSNMDAPLSKYEKSIMTDTLGLQSKYNTGFTVGEAREVLENFFNEQKLIGLTKIKKAGMPSLNTPTQSLGNINSSGAASMLGPLSGLLDPMLKTAFGLNSVPYKTQSPDEIFAEFWTKTQGKTKSTLGNTPSRPKGYFSDITGQGVGMPGMDWALSQMYGSMPSPSNMAQQGQLGTATAWMEQQAKTLYSTQGITSGGNLDMDGMIEELENVYDLNTEITEKTMERLEEETRMIEAINFQFSDMIANVLMGVEDIDDGFRRFFKNLLKQLLTKNIMGGIASLASGGMLGGGFLGKFLGGTAFGGSFDTGGMVPGKSGDPIFIKAHGRERVLTEMDQAILGRGSSGNGTVININVSGAGDGRGIAETIRKELLRFPELRASLGRGY